MKLAAIAPVGCEDLAPDTGYHIAFAQFIVGRGYSEHQALNVTKYTEYFKQHAQMGCFVLLDQATFEQEPPCSFEQLHQAAKDVYASAMTVPDYFHDAERTMNGMHEYMRWRNSEFKGTLVPLLGVLQGNDTDELYRCLLAMVWYCKYLALPRTVAKVCGIDRTVYWQNWADRGLFEKLPGLQVHYLGGQYPYTDAIQAATASESKLKEAVVGFDTAELTTAALNGYKIDDPILLERPELLKRPKDFYNIPRSEVLKVQTTVNNFTPNNFSLIVQTKDVIVP